MRDWLAIEEAIVAGDLDRLREAYGPADDFPNAPDECGQTCLSHAIYRGPVSLVRTLLDLGADPHYVGADGFPALFEAIDRATPDRYEVLTLLLAAGVDVEQRGVNDFTPLHHAACRDDATAIEMLLRHGADPHARTRIDNYATPLEEAELLGRAAATAALRRWLAEQGRIQPF